MEKRVASKNSLSELRESMGIWWKARPSFLPVALPKVPAVPLLVAVMSQIQLDLSSFLFFPGV